MRQTINGYGVSATKIIIQYQRFAGARGSGAPVPAAPAVAAPQATVPAAPATVVLWGERVRVGCCGLPRR